MNSRELVVQALQHHHTNPVPYQIDFTQQALDRLVAFTGDPQIQDKLGGCLHYGQYWGWPTEVSGLPEHYRDEFGVVWNRSGADKDIGVVEQPQIPDLEQQDYRFPEPDLVRLRRDIQQLVDTSGGRFTMMGFGFCMFERSWSLMGMENVLMSMIACPDELEEFYDKICEYYLRLVEVALEYDIDGVYFGDDWGQQKGLIMGAGHWRRFIKPRMARLYARVKAAGRFVVQHSCGDCFEIFDDFVEIGIDCYQTFQPEVYDIYEVKKKYGDKLAFWGGISTQQALPTMTPQQVQREVVRVVKAMREGGGLIIAPTHAIPADVPPENILAMAEVFQNQDRFF